MYIFKQADGTVLDALLTGLATECDSSAVDIRQIEGSPMQTLSGWLLVYLIGTVPLLVFCSAGLSGWFFDYPIGLFIGIFVVLAAPLVLLVLQVAYAPAWNITTLWVGAGLISLRVLSGILLTEKTLLMSHWLTFATIVSVALAWAIVWTWYFLSSERVAAIFA